MTCSCCEEHNKTLRAVIEFLEQKLARRVSPTVQLAPVGNIDEPLDESMADTLLRLHTRIAELEAAIRKAKDKVIEVPVEEIESPLDEAFGILNEVVPSE